MSSKASGGRATKRYGTIDQWCADSGMGRTKTYEKIAKGVIRAVKADGRTLVDYVSGLAYLNSLPPAKIRVSSSSYGKQPPATAPPRQERSGAP
jgi:hypothetical protein